MKHRNVDEIYRLPLIAVETVIFPGLPFNAFLSGSVAISAAFHSMKQEEAVGFVLARRPGMEALEFNVHQVGTCAIVKSVDQSPDGAASAFAIGIERFIIRSLSHTLAGPVIAMVTPLREFENESDALTHSANRLHALVLVYLDLVAARLGETVPPIYFPGDPFELSMCIASVVVPEPEMKQNLLQLVDTHLRLEAELVWLKAEIRRLRQEADQFRTFTLDDQQVRDSLRHMRN